MWPGPNHAPRNEPAVRLVEKPALWGLQVAQRRHPPRAFGGVARKLPDGVEDVRGVGAPVGIDAEVARALGILPEPAAMRAGAVEGMGGDDFADGVDEGAEVDHGQSRE